MTGSTDTSDHLWLVIGGPNPGIHRKSPQLACGRGSPPLPIAIECLSSDEAHSLLRTLQPIVQSLPPQPSYEQILTAFDRSPTVKALFTQARNQHHFYAVVVGSPAAILRSRLGALASRRSFSHPKSMHTRSFWKALAYMIVKGIDDLMPPMDASDAEEDDVTTDAHVVAEPTTRLSNMFADQLRLGSSSQPSPESTANSSASNTGPSPSSLPDTQGGSPDLLAEYRGGQGSGLTRTPIVYTHVRCLRGVVETRFYFSPVPPTTDERARILGGLAGRYLVAHGYTLPDIDQIIQSWELMPSSANDFALRLAGMGVDRGHLPSNPD